MQIHVNAVIGLEQQRGLHTSLAELLLRLVRSNATVKNSAYLAQPWAGVFIFLCIIVTTNPPCRDVARHGKLGTFLFDNEVSEIVLQRELIAEAHTVVIDTEPDDDIALKIRLIQGHHHLIVVIADAAFFTPNGTPRLIKRRITSRN